MDVDADWAWVDDTAEQGWVPPTVDENVASSARIYDHLLGGKDNFTVDRDAAAEMLTVVPDARDAARANRAFLVQAVDAMARSGVRQFLDLGTGIPTSPNVHELARAVVPDAVVVYLDKDPVVVAHDQALLSREEGVHTVMGDLCDPAAVLAHPVVRGALDLTRPIGLIMVAVLHFVELTQAPVVVRRYVHALAPGSQVAISAGSLDDVDPEAIRVVQEAYARSSIQAVARTRAQVEELFDGLELLGPGVHDCYRSRTARVLCGTGVKPGP